MTDILFEPIVINRCTVKNRIFLPAMHLGMAVDFHVTDQITSFYAQRAEGGAGMICAGFATVDDLSGNTQNIGAHDDAFIPGLKKLARAIQSNGALACLQLNHAGRYNFSFFLGGRKPVAPSAVASRMTRETPQEMTLQDIQNTVEAFAAAALRVKKAGFDAVEILSGTGYLISEFLSPLTNQRTDEYGGSFKNRTRFGIEVMDAVRDAVGPDFPLIVRMNGNDFMPGGNTRQELIEYAGLLSSGPADALCINVGWHEARVPQIVTSVPRGAFAYLARGIKETVDVPVIASHRINDPATARDLIENGLCDMVAMGRSLIADPFLPLKTLSGKEQDIVHCIGCAQGCFDNLFKLKHVECLCNPMAGYEYQEQPGKADHRRKVMVAGAGPAGMAAAIAAHDAGHDVVLYEKSGRSGGQLHLAGAPPGRADFSRFAKDLARQVACRDIQVLTEQQVDAKLVKSVSPDHLIIATGATPLIPDIPGIELPIVATAWEILSGARPAGSRVVIVGGGAAGVETALFLAEKGTLSAEMVKFLLVNQAEEPDTLFQLATKGTKTVTLVEMQKKIGTDIGKSTKWGMMQDLDRYGVHTITGATVSGINPGGVDVEQDGHSTGIPADTVVIAAGSTPDVRLKAVMESLDIPFTVIGDAKGVGTAFDAVHSGYRAGRSVSASPATK